MGIFPYRFHWLLHTHITYTGLFLGMMIHSVGSKNDNRLLKVHASYLVHSKIKLLETIPDELCEITVAQY
jgi:hypothetical protein